MIEDTLKRAYKDMDEKTGMFPADWRCSNCGKQLNADGNHPAELYAGTFNGLCYACTSGPAFVVKGSELPDGARLVSHPPACPSWRRDRTTHWAYPDCVECKGLGAKRRYTWSGDFMEYCRPCMERVMKPRKANEVEFLLALADKLEACNLVEIGDNPPLSAAQASVAVAANICIEAALFAYDELPVVWRPQRYLAQQAESRLTKAQLNAKRPDTLRRHLIAALRAEAER